jgi:4-hydroxy-4-methyl-2-oxoglutarate aldolase
MSGLTPTESGSLVARLAALDTCACSDSMDKLGLSGVASGLHPVTVPRRIAGRVRTVQFGPIAAAAAAAGAGLRPAQTAGIPAPAPAVRHAATAAIDAARPGDVIVVAADGRLDAAAWGGILSLAATLRGVAGVVADGACRDVDEAVDLGLPVYARGVTPLTARGRQGEVAWDVAVPLAGVTVHPGDLVIADRSGVVFLPAEHAGQIITAAEEVAAREQALSVRIKNGEPSAAVLSANYERMLAEGRLRAARAQRCIIFFSPLMPSLKGSLDGILPSGVA